MTNKIIYCYYTPNSYYRRNGGRFEPSCIDPDMITHLAYYAFGVNNAGQVYHLDIKLDLKENLIERVINLKLKNPRLKVIAVFGGWDQGSENFSQIAAEPKKRAVFIDSAIDFCHQMGFDGLELDWCYPNQRHSFTNNNDKQNYSALIREFKQSCLQNALQFIISVGATKFVAEKSYDIPEISLYADYILLKTYDFHGSWENVTGANTGLYNVQKCVEYWMNKGAPAPKLLLGLAFYGNSYTLKKSENFHIGAKAIGKGNEGPFTRMPGRLAYNEIVSSRKWIMEWDFKRNVPYAHYDWQWVSFDDEKSLEIKCQFALKTGLCGVEIYSIDYDDFLGNSGSDFPLLEAVVNGLRRDMEQF